MDNGDNKPTEEENITEPANIIPDPGDPGVILQCSDDSPHKTADAIIPDDPGESLEKGK